MNQILWLLSMKVEHSIPSLKKTKSEIIVLYTLLKHNVVVGYWAPLLK